jgi:rhodanese-related sulfurtransferase
MHPDIPSTTVDVLPDPLPDGYAVLDVREPIEWEHGHIDGAVHVPLMELPNRRDEIPEGHVLVVCRVGARSMQATHYLAQQGFDVVNLDGGMVDWSAAGRPMTSENGRPPQVV